MTNTSKVHDRRRAEVLEALAELYLRLNGYFCIRNYLQHRIEGFGLNTESDLLAMRMPHQEEILQNGHRQPNDVNLVLPEESATVDCIIAEVKEPSVEFNKPLRGAEGPHRICSALKMFGVFPGKAFEPAGIATKIGNELHAQINAKVWAEHPKGHSPEHAVSVRLVVFAPETAKHCKERKHFDFQSVLDFTRSRMRPGDACAEYRDPKVASASPWRGCTRLIVEILDESHSANADLPLEQLIERVIARWNTLGGPANGNAGI